MHVGLIMDGNRRWAKSKNLSIVLGHNTGGDNLEKILTYCRVIDIKELTCYVLSTENYQSRGAANVKTLINMITDFADKKRQKLINQEVKVKIIGDISTFSVQAKKSLEELVNSTKKFHKIVLNLCINYGSQQEILQAVKNLINQGIKPEEINLQTFTRNLQLTSSPDLIIRTGGHQRLSNFLLWQAAYSEFYFTETLWPNFTTEELKKAVESFKQSQRNFGK